MRWLIVLLLAVVAAADEADEYFDIGVAYLRKGFFDRARMAFAESLVRAPREPVTLTFLGIASAAEGRPAVETALFLRSGMTTLRKGETLRLDLKTLLPSARALTLLHGEHARARERARGATRVVRLQVLAFLEVMDGSPKTAPALDALLSADPESEFAKALDRVRKPTPRPGP